MRLYLARHEGDLVAATTWVRVGTHAWYSYGASSNLKREVRGSNAIQWRMIRDALAAGSTVYDLRGITEGLGADDPEIGLIQFKVGTGGEAVQYLGEWDLPINRALYTAFSVYMDRAKYVGLAKKLVRLPTRGCTDGAHARSRPYCRHAAGGAGRRGGVGPSRRSGASRGCSSGTRFSGP